MQAILAGQGYDPLDLDWEPSDDANMITKLAGQFR